ncbi:MAG: flagellar type III secretion system protein FliR [Alphaproteobacteria bacterium]|nr:flagellar type III secretion system protein FliR [Alphaproteobacteria bacterium]
MTSYSWLPGEVFLLVLIFARVGSAMLLLPGIAEMDVSPRIRLSLALLVVVVLRPGLSGALPAMPGDFGGLLVLLVQEIAIGLCLGLVIRLFVSALQIAGTTIAMQTGLGFAQSLDPSQGIQGALVATFLALLGSTLILMSDLHHLMLAALHDCYVLFPVGAPPPVADMTELVRRTISATFALGIAIAAPFLVFGLLFYVAMGLLSRLMPQLHIFFLAMPLNILLSFAILSALIGMLMTFYLGRFEEHVSQFVAG